MNETNKEAEELGRELQDKCKIEKNCGSLANNNYQKDSLDGAKISAGSQESVFSSASDSDYVNSDSASGDSGSDNQSLETDIKALNQHCTVAPRIKRVSDYVDEVRVKFLKNLSDKGDDDSYDSLDIEELKKPLESIQKLEQSLAFRLIDRFCDWQLILAKDSAEPSEKQTDEILESLKELLVFRNTFQLSNALSDQFCKEFYMLNGIFTFGHDKQNVPVLYLRASVHRKWSHNLDHSMRRFVAWQFNKITKSHHGAVASKSVGNDGMARDGSFVLCFDCLNVSYSCIDLDFLRFIVRCLVQYYPGYCRYALCVDLPWLFRSVWKLVRSWLPEEAQNNVQLITAKELLNYIDATQIPTSMRCTGERNKHPVPEDWNSIRGLEEFAKEFNMSSSEVKQFKAHVEKVRKEYEKLGA